MNSTVQNNSSRNVEIIAACSILNFICCITGSIGNLLVLLSYYYYRNMRTITNLYLCSLALVDLVVCVIIQPLYITNLVNKLAESEENAHFETVRKILTWFIMTMALGNLASVMIDRYCRVSFPLKYRVTMSKKRCYVIIIFFWLVSVVASITLIVKPDVKMIIQCYAIILINGLIIPGYVRVFIIARRQSKKMVSQMKYLRQISQQPTKEDAFRLKNAEDKSCRASDYEAIKTIFIVIAVFIVCWTPLLFFPFYYRWTSLKSRSNLPFIFPIINTLALCSSSINPFIYCLRTPPFKHSFQQIIIKFCTNILNLFRNNSKLVISV